MEAYLKVCLQELARSAMGLLSRLEGDPGSDLSARENLIKNNQGKDIVFDIDDKPSIAIMSFDHSEAKGTIAIERGNYGVWLWVDGKALGGVDLFHQAVFEAGEESYPLIHINDNHGEAVAHIRFPKGRIEFVPEDNSKPRWEVDNPAVTES